MGLLNKLFPTLDEIQKETYYRKNVATGFLRTMIKHKWFPLLPIVVNFSVFVILAIAGIFGTQLGNANSSIIFIWILWWFALIGVLVPLTGRGWCTICPLCVFGEWVQRKSVVETNFAIPNETFMKMYPMDYVKRFVQGRPLSLMLEWPKKMDNLWGVNLFFLTIAIFSPIVTTHPSITVFVVGSFFFFPLLMSLIWRGRTFCKYLCPIGGFIGLFSNFAPLEMRVKERDRCHHHKVKMCISGVRKLGHGCPWGEFPQTLNRNSYCGLCFECWKTCPYDNMNVNIRPPAIDLVKDAKDKNISEAFKSLIMLNLSIMYLTILLGPYGLLKDMATFRLGFWMWVPYVIMFVGTSLVITPGLMFMTTWISKTMAGKGVDMKKLFIDQSVALVPLALMGWIGFSVTLLQVNWTYVLNVLSDPFALGWDMIGTAHLTWAPLFPVIIPWFEGILVMVGVIYASYVTYLVNLKTYKDKNVALKATAPGLIFILFIATIYLRLFIG